MSSIQFHQVAFAYTGAPDGLFSELSFGVSEGWTGIIGANGFGKTTLLRLACGELEPRGGTIARPATSLYCPQRTDEPMNQFAEFLDAVDGDAYRLRGRLGIEDDWLTRWSTLSHGERKRAQIATCLWLNPELLAVDEPTNHLDTQARSMVKRALRSYRGIGLLVSHDRALLDGLCGHCLFVSPQAVALRSGGYTTAYAALAEEDRAAGERRAKALADARRLEKEMVVRRAQQEKSHRGRSKRGIARKDHDAKERIDRARLADRGAGKRLRQLEGRIEQAQANATGDRRLPQFSMGISFQGCASTRNALFRIEAGSLPLGEQRILTFEDLVMLPQDRIALIGPNGSGKSTFIRHILRQLDLPQDRIVYIAQAIDAEASAAILERVQRAPNDLRGRIMTWVSRLGSDPRGLLESRLPSPGEVRKLLLAERIAYEPHLIILDEPTNHMDLPSIECLESALRDCSCGLLLVSHDQRFLDRLASRTWRIDPVDSQALCLTQGVCSTVHG